MNLKNKKILILAADGFIGKSIKNFLTKKNVKLLTYSKTKGNNLLNLNKFISFIKRNKPSIIINCAAVHGSLQFVINNPAKIVFNNLQIIINIYEGIKKANLKKVLVINPLANCSYSANDNIQKETNWWNGIPNESSIAFGSTRRMVQIVSSCYEKQFNIKSKNFILPGVYGPNNHVNEEKLHALDGIILRMTKAKKNKLKIFKIWGSGKPIREWCFIDDVVKFIYLLISRKHEINFPINLGQKKGYSIKKLSHIIKKKIKYEGKLVFDKSYIDGAKIKVLDDKLFKKNFPKFKFTSIEKGITESIKYYSKIVN
jgi:GDP-L-fucose synthase